jgi:post-segregation antitoxin (ccd killing protein)
MNQNDGLNLTNSSSRLTFTRVKVNSWKRTIGITLPQNLVERARFHGLNISRVTEQALTSILDYLEAQKTQISSNFLSTGSFQKESVVPRAGFEPATTRSSASPPTVEALSRALSQAELPRHFSD